MVRKEKNYSVNFRIKWSSLYREPGEMFVCGALCPIKPVRLLLQWMMFSSTSGIQATLCRKICMSWDMIWLIHWTAAFTWFQMARKTGAAMEIIWIQRLFITAGRQIHSAAMQCRPEMSRCWVHVLPYGMIILTPAQTESPSTILLIVSSMRFRFWVQRHGEMQKTEIMRILRL